MALIRVLREGNPLQKTTGPPGWGFSVGPTIPPRKNYRVTAITIKNSNPQGLMEISDFTALRNILNKQSLEWNTSLCINFVDFKKAFDSVDLESLRKILQAYGLPPKIINLIKMFYDNFECTIILKNTITEAFPGKSGVRQGCVLLPILFHVFIDWVTRQATFLSSLGIQ